MLLLIPGMVSSPPLLVVIPSFFHLHQYNHFTQYSHLLQLSDRYFSSHM